jgi:hypothetical protein
LLSEVGTDNKKSERQPAPTINNQLPTTVTQQPETSHNHWQWRQPTTSPTKTPDQQTKQLTTDTAKNENANFFLAILAAIGKDCSYLVTEHHFLVSVAHQSFDLFYCIPALKFDWNNWSHFIIW